MFLHLSVILFTGEFCLNACWDTTPLGAGTPPPWTRHPQEQATPPPGADTPLSRHPPRPGNPQSRHPPRPGIPPGADTPRAETATAADGTHPIGMHSCYYLHLLLFTLIVDFKIWFLTFVQLIFTIIINSLYVSGMIETISSGSNTYKTKISIMIPFVQKIFVHLFLYHYVKSSFFLSTC